MYADCPHCGHINSPPDEYEGRLIKCDKCEGEFTAKAHHPDIGPEKPQTETVTARPITEQQGYETNLAPTGARLFLSLCATALTCIFVGYFAYHYGHDKGSRFGYKLGYMAGEVDGAAQARAGLHRTQQVPKSPTTDHEQSAPLPAYSLGNYDFKIMEQGSDYWVIAWRIDIRCHEPGTYFLTIRFIDSAGYAIAKAGDIFTVHDAKGLGRTDTINIDAASASKINSMTIDVTHTDF